MFPTENRLARSDGFDQTIRRGERVGNRYMVAHFLPAHSPTETPPKFGVAVAKRQVPKASARNRLKRQVRHLLMARADEIPRGSSLVIRVLSRSEGKNSADLGWALDSILGKLLKPRSAKGSGQRKSRDRFGAKSPVTAVLDEQDETKSA